MRTLGIWYGRVGKQVGLQKDADMEECRMTSVWKSGDGELVVSRIIDERNKGKWKGGGKKVIEEDKSGMKAHEIEKK